MTFEARCSGARLFENTELSITCIESMVAYQHPFEGK